MRLKQIIAERFGRLEGTTLGNLGPGLNVVLGPNEAGKTSFSALVRHVLYGYPTKRDTEAGYESKVGKRLGRLVFADDGGEWAVERTEGPHGGPVGVHVVSGSERQGLRESITRGISRDAFRIVFGFGLEQLAAIEAKKGSGDDILSPLYAAQVGLANSPSDVRHGLIDDAEKLWVKRGSTRELNTIKSEIKTVRDEIGELEKNAVRFAEDRRMLEELGHQLELARVERDRLAARAAALASAAQRVADLEQRLREAREQEREAVAAIAALRVELDGIEADPKVLAVATELEALVGDLPLFTDRLNRAEEQARAAASARSRAAEVIDAVGLAAEEAGAVDVGPATQSGIETSRGRLATLGSQAAASMRAAEIADDTLAAALGQSTVSDGASTHRAHNVLPGIAIGALGIAVAVVGALGGAWVTVALGVSILAAGIVVAFQMSRHVPLGMSSERIADLRRQADATRSTADRDAAAFEAARDEWRAWLAGAGLARAGDDPAVAAKLVSSVNEHRGHLAQAERHETAAREETEWCESYRDRLTAIAGTFLSEPAITNLVEVPLLAARARNALERARAEDLNRHGTTEAIARAQREADAARQRADAARDEQRELLERHADSAEDAHEFSSHAEVAEREASEATTAHDEIAQEYASLRGRLDNEGHDARMAELRLDLTGLEERRERVLETYAVLAVAERLMARAQSFNEQARQPEVIRRASEVFEQITDGRYVRVSPPAEDGHFRVFDATSEAKDTRELSTGTAQQLYLAVRIALVEQLDDMGEGLPVLMDDVLVNFDPERRAGTAKAVAELARHRQVILFTCHPEVAALFASIEPGLTALELDRC